MSFRYISFLCYNTFRYIKFLFYFIELMISCYISFLFIVISESVISDSVISISFFWLYQIPLHQILLYQFPFSGYISFRYIRVRYINFLFLLQQIPLYQFPEKMLHHIPLYQIPFYQLPIPLCTIGLKVSCLLQSHERRWRRHTNLYPFLSPSLPSLPILFSFPSPFLPSPSFLCFSLRKANFTQLLPSTSKMSTKLINKKIVSRTRAPPTKRKGKQNITN